MLKFFEVEARFPENAGEIPVPAVSYVAQQVKVPAEDWAQYDWSGRAIKRHRVEIRSAFGFRECTEEDQAQLAGWLATELCGVELNRDRLAEAVVVRCRGDRMEPPTPGRIARLVGSAVNTFEERFCADTVGRLSAATRSRLDDLVAEDVGADESAGGGVSFFTELKAELRRQLQRTYPPQLEFDTGFIAEFTSVATRENLSRDVRRRRLPLVLFGLGTNMGIKRVAVTGKHGESEATLRRVRHLFVRRANMRAALRKLVNATFAPPGRDVVGHRHRVCLRQPPVRRLVQQPDDRVAPVKPRPRCRYPLSAQSGDPDPDHRACAAQSQRRRAFVTHAVETAERGLPPVRSADGDPLGDSHDEQGLACGAGHLRSP